MKARTGIFGGAFDPIHFGHLRSAEEIGERFKLDRVIFIPPFVHPLKNRNGGASPEQRLDMARLAVSGNPRFEVSDFEIKRGGVSYTIDTLEYFGKIDPDTELYFMLGADGWREITSWHRYNEIFAKANVIVHARPGFKLDAPECNLPSEFARQFTKRVDRYAHASGMELGFAEVTAIELSATAIRDKRKKGQSIRYLVPDKVCDYIERNGLYT